MKENKQLWLGDYVGFKSYEWKGKPVRHVLIDKNTLEASKTFVINTDNLIFKPTPPEKIRLWQEIKNRLALAWAALRHGRDYFD